MPRNIFAGSTETEIFRDERFLYPEFVPDKLPFREPQIEQMVLAFKPILRGGRPHNLFVHGSTGTGKTVTVKFVLRQLEDFSSRAKGLYLNCFEFGSRYSILAEISNFLGSPVPRRGISTDEAYTEMLQALKRVNFTPIIVLDEIDQLLKGNEISSILYDLLRVVEFQKSHFGLCFISNDSGLLAGLDARVKSSLMQQSIAFEQYTPIQLKAILRERAKNAFFPNVLDPEVLNVAAAHAAKKGGDARIAIESLLIAGRNAEKECAKKVSIEHLQNAFDSIHERSIQKSAPFLDEHEKKILKILCKKDRIRSGELFNEFKKSGSKLTLRSFRKKLNRLADLKLLRLEEKSKGIRGRTRIAFLAIEKKAIEELL